MQMLKMFSKKNFIVNFITSGESLNLNHLRAFDSAQIGIIFDMNCLEVEKMFFFEKNFQPFFKNNNFWILLERSSEFDDFDSVDHLKNAIQSKYTLHFTTHPVFLIDSEVVIAIAPSKYMNWTLIDIYKISKNDMQYKLTEIKNSGVTLYKKDNMFQVLAEFGTSGRRRSNLEGIYLRCGMVIQFPEIFTGINDLNNKVYDTFTKGKQIQKNLQV